MKSFNNIFLFFIPLIIAFLIVSEIVISNDLASLSGSVQEMENTIELYKEENELLSERIASASALVTIEKQAEILGLIEPQKSSYLVFTPSEFPVAFHLDR